MVSASNLHGLIEETGKALLEVEHPQTNSGVIRELQSYFDSVDLQTAQPTLRCLIFILDLLIEDIFYNLSGDGPYNDIIYEVRDAVFRQFGITLTEVGGQLTNGDDIPWEELCRLISEYLTQLHKLNIALYTKNFESD